MNKTYNVAYPDGEGDYSYSNLTDTSISGLNTQLDNALVTMKAEYKNIYTGINQYGSQSSQIVNRTDPTDVSNYEDYYPFNNQASPASYQIVPIYTVSVYPQSETINYLTCSLKNGTLLVGNSFCIDFTHSSDYNFAIPSV